MNVCSKRGTFYIQPAWTEVNLRRPPEHSPYGLTLGKGGTVSRLLKTSWVSCHRRANDYARRKVSSEGCTVKLAEGHSLSSPLDTPLNSLSAWPHSPGNTGVLAWAVPSAAQAGSGSSGSVQAERAPMTALAHCGRAWSIAVTALNQEPNPGSQGCSL